jgi:hypothetical protein
MARALKVFRTPIGFHDDYVAASSRKAALEAWGGDADLFACGMVRPLSQNWHCQRFHGWVSFSPSLFPS